MAGLFKDRAYTSNDVYGRLMAIGGLAFPSLHQRAEGLR